MQVSLHAAHPPRTGKPVLEAKDLCVNVGTHRVLSHVDLTVQEGEMVGIAGPNGGGKTTLLRALLGLAPRCCGTLRLFGVPDTEFRERRRIGYVAQGAAHVDPGFPATAEEIVRLGRVAPRGLLRRLNAEDRTLALEALRDVGAEHLRHRRIGNLSGGERQRVLLARALASRPELLLLDEPTTGFDPTARQEFLQVIRHLNEDHGMTILVVSHDLDVLAHLAKRMIVVDHAIRHDGPASPDGAWPEHIHLHGHGKGGNA